MIANPDFGTIRVFFNVSTTVKKLDVYFCRVVHLFDWKIASGISNTIEYKPN